MPTQSLVVQIAVVETMGKDTLGCRYRWKATAWVKIKPELSVGSYCKVCHMPTQSLAIGICCIVQTMDKEM